MIKYSILEHIKEQVLLLRKKQHLLHQGQILTQQSFQIRGARIFWTLGFPGGGGGLPEFLTQAP